MFNCVLKSMMVMEIDHSCGDDDGDDGGNDGIDDVNAENNGGLCGENDGDA